ncbi:dienelactone hydrolase family protein [Vitiosangium sp. GDMCC 1.1324]|uniref:dienelactone hydrolase family protein n=1 Tax=Vitiosangium sp. (strain GDMCC 1.1324) TaxID=2138576 RepID=UPI000D35AFDD|nr:dienelactone hydrolase family protein [Vitiosangium sp. GDMCC 1.1324]PTL85003.1 dienelactone hydrolase [Vitiosangium sp. GDMCC 1.1324]
MHTTGKPRAPAGDLSTFMREVFIHEGVSHDVFRKGHGPAVLVMADMPGISPQLLGFADRVVALGCTAVLPDLFGTAGRDPLVGGVGTVLYGLSTMARACISREFTVLATGRSSPIVTWLRALAAQEHGRCGGPGVGVVGMCFTGGFALAMAVDPRVLAPVLSQPSLPLAFTKRQRRSIDCEPATLEAVAGRCAAEGLRVLGLRFKGDPFVPDERFDFLRERLGEGFVAVELAQADGHPEGPLPVHHGVLTVDFVDAPGEPTHAALEQVLTLFRTRLLAG